MSNVELYHGSPHSDIEILEPRRAGNGAVLKQIETPAVYASSDIDYAIFMAVIGNRKWGGWNHEEFGWKGFYIYKEFADYLDLSKYHEPTGTVYFVDATTFELNKGHEWLSTSLAKVLGSLAVGLSDLPTVAINNRKHPSHYRK